MKGEEIRSSYRAVRVPGSSMYGVSSRPVPLLCLEVWIIKYRIRKAVREQGIGSSCEPCRETRCPGWCITIPLTDKPLSRLVVPETGNRGRSELKIPDAKWWNGIRRNGCQSQKGEGLLLSFDWIKNLKSSIEEKGPKTIRNWPYHPGNFHPIKVYKFA